MEYNLAQLTAKIVTIISPFSPVLTGFVKLAGEGLAKWVGEKGGEKLWNVAQKAWNTIQSRKENDMELNGVMTMVAASPDDQTRRKELIKVLAARFKDEPELVRELEILLNENREAIQVVAANQDRTIETVVQGILGSGKQSVTADGKSSIKGATQK